MNIYNSNFNIGFHISISKKKFKKSIEHYHNNCNINAFQCFLNTPMQKKIFSIDDNELLITKNYVTDNNLFLVCHSPYVINIATPEEDLINSNIEYVINELILIEKMGGAGSIYHVGKSVKTNPNDGFNLMFNFIKKVISKMIDLNIKSYFILETGAGCGTELCCDINKLAEMFHLFSDTEKKYIKFCIDTCHIFSAGYNIHDNNGVIDFINSFENIIGWNNVICIHLNDSKNKCGSRVDRHENFNKGFISKDNYTPIKYFISHCNNLNIPLILETPVSDNDVINDRNNEIELIKNWFI